HVAIVSARVFATKVSPLDPPGAARPRGRGLGRAMPSEPIPTYLFALVVVRRGGRFLVVHEAKHGQRWYLPAGRVEPGEPLFDGARREVLEETGIPVELTGVLRIEHTAYPEMTRVRVFFTAEPVDDRPPKSRPDEHSLAARWVT